MDDVHSSRRRLLMFALLALAGFALVCGRRTPPPLSGGESGGVEVAAAPPAPLPIGESAELRAAPRATVPMERARRITARGHVTFPDGRDADRASVVLASTESDQDDERSSVLGRTTSDAHGRFEIALASVTEELALARMTIAATTAEADAVSLFPMLASLPRGADGAFEAELVVRAVGSIEGRVTAADRSPVAGAHARIWARWPDAGPGYREFPCAPDGAYRVTGIAGPGGAKAQAPGWFYADGSHLFAVQPGATTRLDLVLTKLDAECVVRFVDAEAHPVPHVKVGHHLAYEWAEVESDEGGRVKLTVGGADTNVHLEVRRGDEPWFVPGNAEGSLHLDRALAQDGELVVALEKGAFVRGHVRTAAGVAIGPGLRVYAFSGDSAATDAGGAFEFERPFKSGAEKFEADPSVEVTDVTIGTGVQELELVARPAAWIEVRVLRTDGQPLSTNWPHVSSQCGLHVGVARADGTAFLELGPIGSEGRFGAWVPVDEADGAAVFRVDRPVERDLAHSPPFGSLRAGQRVATELRVAPGAFAAVRGRARFPDSGEIPTSLSFQFKRKGDRETNVERHAFSFATDRFELPLLFAGAFDLVVTSGNGAATIPIELKAGEVLDLGTIDLHPR